MKGVSSIVDLNKTYPDFRDEPVNQHLGRAYSLAIEFNGEINKSNQTYAIIMTVSLNSLSAKSPCPSSSIKPIDDY